MPITVVNPVVFDEKIARGGVQESVHTLLEEQAVVLVSKSFCPYAIAVKSLLSNQLQVEVHVLEIDQTGNADAIQKCLEERTKIRTVPQVFLDGKFLGTADDVLGLDHKGFLEPKLKEHVLGPRQPATGSNDEIEPLFFFPPTVNKWGIRATGLLSSGISVAMAVGMWKQAPVVGMASAVFAGDYTLRFLSGSKVAPVAQLGSAIADAAGLDPVPRPGAPKQFASLCGVMFSGLGAACYASGRPDLGGGFMAVLALCSGLEGAVDFCLGCKFFAMGRKAFKLRKSVSVGWQKQH